MAAPSNEYQKKKERGVICFTCCCFQGQYDLDPLEMKKNKLQHDLDEVKLTSYFCKHKSGNADDNM